MKNCAVHDLFHRLFNHLFRTSDIWNGEVEFYINDEESDAEST